MYSNFRVQISGSLIFLITARYHSVSFPTSIPSLFKASLPPPPTPSPSSLLSNRGTSPSIHLKMGIQKSTSHKCSHHTGRKPSNRHSFSHTGCICPCYTCCTLECGPRGRQSDRGTLDARSWGRRSCSNPDTALLPQWGTLYRLDRRDRPHVCSHRCCSDTSTHTRRSVRGRTTRTGSRPRGTSCCRTPNRSRQCRRALRTARSVGTGR